MLLVEIGPGDGALTDLLVEEAHLVGGSVVLVELDEKYAGIMADRYRGNPRRSGSQHGCPRC